jgi:NhaP-type Na+/H+ or K+/H+ antiporter
VKKIIFISFIITILFSNKAFAYLDPGTGSIIIQSIIGAIGAGASIGAIYWQKVKYFFNKKFKKKNKNI